VNVIRRCLAVAVVAVVLTSCQSESEEGKDPMRTMARDNASRMVDEYTRGVVAAIAPDARPWNETGNKPSPCVAPDGRTSGDDKYFLRSMFNVAVPAKQQVAALTRIRDYFIARGFGIDRFDVTDMEESPGGTVDATNPQDDFLIYAMSTIDSDHLAVWITTPCYATPGSQPPWTAGITPGPSTTSK